MFRLGYIVIARHFATWERFLLVLLALGIIPAAYPLFVYVDNTSFLRPVLLTAAIAALHALLLIRTYHVLINSHSDETQSRWATWRQGFQKIWKWYAAFALLRFGLAIAFSQLLHMSFVQNCTEYGLDPFCHWSCDIIGGLSRQLYYPAIQVAPAFTSLVAYSFLEAGLASAIVLFVQSKRITIINRVVPPLMLALALRLTLLLVALTSYNFLNVTIYSENTAFSDGAFQYAAVMCRNLSVEESDFTKYYSTVVLSEERRNGAIAKLVSDNLIIVPFTLIDNATLLSADLMRQSWSWIAVVQRIPAVVGGLLLYIGVIWILVRASSVVVSVPNTDQ